MNWIIILFAIVTVSSFAKNSPNEIKEFHEIILELDNTFQYDWNEDRYIYCATELDKSISSNYKYKMDEQSYPECFALISNFAQQFGKSKERLFEKYKGQNIPNDEIEDLRNKSEILLNRLSRISVKIGRFDEMYVNIQARLRGLLIRLDRVQIESIKLDSIKKQKEQIGNHINQIIDEINSQKALVKSSIEKCNLEPKYSNWVQCIIASESAMQEMISTYNNVEYNAKILERIQIGDVIDMFELELVNGLNRYQYSDKILNVLAKEIFACNNIQNIAKKDICHDELAGNIKKLWKTKGNVFIGVPCEFNSGQKCNYGGYNYYINDLDKGEVWNNCKGKILSRENSEECLNEGYQQCIEIGANESSIINLGYELNVCFQFASSKEASLFDLKKMNNVQCQIKGGMEFKQNEGKGYVLYCLVQ